jgi:hypothetical protein
MTGTLETLADRLSDFGPVDRPVIDETGRPGMYLVLFTWSQGEDFIGALEEISGLKFEPRKAPLDYYFVCVRGTAGLTRAAVGAIGFGLPRLWV